MKRTITCYGTEMIEGEIKALPGQGPEMFTLTAEEADLRELECLHSVEPASFGVGDNGLVYVGTRTTCTPYDLELINRGERIVTALLFCLKFGWLGRIIAQKLTWRLDEISHALELRPGRA